MHFKILTSCRSLALSVISVAEGGGPYNYNRNDINFGSASLTSVTSKLIVL